MTPELEARVDEELVAIRALYRDNFLTADQYHKALVCVAYEYAIRDDALRAAGIVQTIPVEYFKTVQQPQMLADPNYAYVSYTLALTLVQEGIVHLGPRVSANVPGATA